MNCDVLLHVIDMVNDRKLRAALGYNVDRCIQLRIPPCALRMKPHFIKHLEFLYLMRRYKKNVRVFDKVNRCEILVGFHSELYIGWRRNNHFLQTWMSISTGTVLRVNRSRDGRVVQHVVDPKSVDKMWYADPFTGECLSSTRTVRDTGFQFKTMGSWDFFIKPKYGHLVKRTNKFPTYRD